MDELQMHFASQQTVSAFPASGGGGTGDHGPDDNSHFHAMSSGSRRTLGLPDSNTRESERYADMFVSAVVGGGIKDASMNNAPREVTAQRHVTTNAAPLPNIPAGLERGRTGGVGTFEANVFRAQQQASRDVDVHRVLNSFAPPETRLHQFEYNEGGALGAHQGLGVRFNTAAEYNHYGRSVKPSDVSKKEPLPSVFRMQPQRAVPSSDRITSAERAMMPLTRDNEFCALSERDSFATRERHKDGGVQAPTGRPDTWVESSRRDNSEPRVTRLEVPARPHNRGHALFAGEQQLLRQRQQVNDSQ